MRFAFVIAAAAAASGLGAISLATPAEAKPARCFTTDDGYFNCDFKGLDSAGSFQISGRGYPTYTLEVDRPGFAFGYVDLGTGRTIPLPGQFVRQRDDTACWANPETDVKICAW